MKKKSVFAISITAFIAIAIAVVFLLSKKNVLTPEAIVVNEPKIPAVSNTATSTTINPASFTGDPSVEIITNVTNEAFSEQTIANESNADISVVTGGKSDLDNFEDSYLSNE